MDNKAYILDLDAIINFILKDDESRTSNSEITEMYVQDEESSDLVLTNKQLREIKNNGDTSSFTIKYDMIKTFITILDEIADGNANNATFMQKIAFNSLVAKELIKEIKISDNE